MRVKIKAEEIIKILEQNCSSSNTNKIINSIPDEVVLEGEPIETKRTGQQRKGMEVLFKGIADLCNENNISFYQLIKKPMEIECTKENIKMLFRKVCEFLYGVKSTKDLRRDGQIDVAYDHLNKIIIERTEGKVIIPPFPSRGDK